MRAGQLTLRWEFAIHPPMAGVAPAEPTIASQLTRAVQRLAYYLAGARRQSLPARMMRKRTEALRAAFETHPEREALEHRARYYMKIQNSFAPQGPCRGDIPFKHSRYFFDFMEHALGFPEKAQFDPLFGDVIYVPDTPRLVKSRPLTEDNQNGVLFPFDKFRHFLTLDDPQPFRDKKPTAVWRGAMHSVERIVLVHRHAQHKDHDIGHTGPVYEGVQPKGFLTPRDQIKHKYLLSVEGIDVATNLKWMMGTNCLVLSPPLRFESWYMEGALEPSKHFVELAPDFSDLDEKIEFYNSNPDAAETIIAAAQAWRRSFNDAQREAMVVARVLDLYLEYSNQS